MEGDLLRREQEFHKINFELEERTNRILQEIDAVKNRAGPHNSSNVDHSDRTKMCQSKSFSLKSGEGSTSTNANKEGKEICTQRKKDLVDDPLTICSNGLSYEATNRLLRAKLTILNKEVDTLRQDYKVKSEECRRTNATLTRTEEECTRLESLLSTARETAANLHSKLETTSQSLLRTQAENTSISKDFETLKKEMKQQKQQTSALELRLNRALEENEKLRQANKQTQLQNKEYRENQRRSLDQLQSKIKGLERQRNELMSVSTKQTHLIDNLRRQKVHFEVSRFVQTAETEFENILDWCLKSEEEAS